MDLFYGERHSRQRSVRAGENERSSVVVEGPFVLVSGAGCERVDAFTGYTPTNLTMTPYAGSGRN